MWPRLAARPALLIPLVLIVLLPLGSNVYGDAGVVLDESLNTGFAKIIATGHSAIYLSRICPDSPVKLRLCQAGEHGSIISNYRRFGEDYPFEWNATPLSVYVYGVDAPSSRPIFGSKKIKRVLEDRYRDKYLSSYCRNEFCATNPKAEWRYLVGAGLSRSVYIFVVKTTLQQDLDLIAHLNSAPNVNDFNPFTRNCADFTMSVINYYFPQAVHSNRINDFGIAGPKAIARSFARYARKHPELNLRVLHFAQVPGTIPRSSVNREGTELFYRSEELLIPTVIFANHELPVFGAAYLLYLLTGRFNPAKTLQQYPEAPADNFDPGGFEPNDLETHNRGPRSLESDPLGSPEEWRQYHRRFNAIVDQAVREGFIPGSRYLNSLFRRLDEIGVPYMDADGNLWMKISQHGKTARVGLSESNILAANSDESLAYGLLLAHTHSVLKSPEHRRESMWEFQNDWDLMQYARLENRAQDSGLAQRPHRTLTPPSQTPVVFVLPNRISFRQHR